MKLNDETVEFKEDERGLMEVVSIVLALVMIVVVGAIGVFIADTTLTATGTPNNSRLANMSTDILSAGDTGTSFIVILVIAFIGGIAIAYLLGMAGRSRRKG